jgi:hypothetical protein
VTTSVQVRARARELLEQKEAELARAREQQQQQQQPPQPQPPQQQQQQQQQSEAAGSEAASEAADADGLGALRRYAAAQTRLELSLREVMAVPLLCHSSPRPPSPLAPPFMAGRPAFTPSPRLTTQPSYCGRRASRKRLSRSS